MIQKFTSIQEVVGTKSIFYLLISFIKHVGASWFNCYNLVWCKKLWIRSPLSTYMETFKYFIVILYMKISIIKDLYLLKIILNLLIFTQK